jgi:hypothetical protein
MSNVTFSFFLVYLREEAKAKPLLYTLGYFLKEIRLSAD